MDPIIIVGAGMAGFTVARELRKLDKDVPLLVITGDAGGFYSKPMLSNAFAMGKSPASLISQDATQMAAQLQATILTGTQVSGIDPNTQEIHTSSGTFRYRALVLGVGAQAIRLALDGDGAADVMSVNHIRDYQALRARIDGLKTQPARVVILGAGLIGCEFADDFSSAGHQVTLVDPSPRPLNLLTPPAIGEGLQRALITRGVNFALEATASRIERTDQAYRVLLSNGTELAADILLSAVGLRPDLTLAQAAGLTTGRGIIVDDHGRTSAANVYALGDCAEYTLPGGAGQQTMPYIAPLMNAARAIAKSLAGQATSIDHRSAAVIVKTPSYPIALQLPSATLMKTGRWHIRHQGEQIISRFLDAEDRQQGYAIAPQDAPLRKKMSDEIGSHFRIEADEASSETNGSDQGDD